MPSLGLGGYNSPSMFASKLTPFSGNAPVMPEEEQQRLTQRLFDQQSSRNEHMGWIPYLGRLAASTGIDLADTVASSSFPAFVSRQVGSVLGTPSVQRGDLWDLTGEYGMSAGRDLQAFYENNASTVEAMSGITGAVATGYAAGALVLPKITHALASSTMINQSRLWQAGARANAAVRARLATAQAEAVAQGQAFSYMGAAGMQYTGLRAAQGIGIAAFEEAAIVAVLNQNELILSDDWADNLTWTAAGLGMGGAFGTAAARFEMRRAMNASGIQSARAASMDSQEMLRLWEDQPDYANIPAMLSNNIEGKESAIYTSLRLASQQQVAQNIDPGLAAKMNQFKVQAADQANHVLQRQTLRGINGIDNTGFSIADKNGETFGAHFREASKDNPLLLLSAESIGTVNRVEPQRIRPQLADLDVDPDSAVQFGRDLFQKSGGPGFKSSEFAKYKLRVAPSEAAKAKQEFKRLEKQYGEWTRRMKAAQDSGSSMRAMHEARKIRIESLRFVGGPDNMALARKLETQQAMMLVNKGLMPADLDDAFEFAEYAPGRIKMQQKTAGVPRYDIELTSGAKRVIDESLDPGALHNFRSRDWLETVEGMNRIIGTLSKSKQALVVPKNASWVQLDSFLELEKRGAKIDWKSQAGLTNSEEAQLASFKNKAKEFGSLKSPGAANYWMRLKMNLPLPSALERIYDPAGDSLLAIFDAANRGATLDELKTLRKQMMNQHGFRLDDPEVRLDGGMFAFNRDEKTGKWLDTPIIYYDTAPANPVFSPALIAEQIAERKAERIGALTSNAKPQEMVPAMTVSILQSQEFKFASQVRQLMDDQVTGLGNHFTQLTGEILTREFRYRDSKIMLSSLKLREHVNRLTDSYLQNLVSTGMGDTIARLNAAPAAKSKVLLNQFISNTSGWDLKAAPVPATNGLWAFELMDTSRNAARLGRAVQDGERLFNPRTSAEIVLDDLGIEFMERFNKISEAIRLDRNRIRVALGLEEIASKTWYTPPAYTKNKYVAFTFDADNKVIPGGAIIGETQEHFTHLLRTHREKLQPGQKIFTREEVESTADIYALAQIDWVDPGTGVAAAKGQTGALAIDTVNQYAVQDTMNWIKRSVESNANGTMRVLFDSQLSIARMRGATERAGTASKAIRGSKRTIWDEYEATILGRKLGDTQQTISGNVARPIENFIDRTLEASWPIVSKLGPTQIGRWYSNLLDLTGVPQSMRRKARTFNELASQLGPYTPYKNAVDFAEQTMKVQRPPEIKKISEALNMIAATTLLRVFELPHAAMNLIGVMTTMPSIVQSGKAPITGFVQTQGGGKIGIVDTYKILAESIHDMTRQSRHADWNYMVKMGYTQQQVAEYNMLMSQLTDQGSFKRIMLGDANRTGNTMRDKALRKGAVGVASLATDWTESASRTFSHFVGLRLADMQGVIGLEARHSFAHEIANAAIANYNPMNRPELYQSAFGSMFGLFMSWMQSYNQRLFRWMETGEYASMARQLGMQSALFGVASMPGYKQLESLLMATGAIETEDGREATAMDAIYAKFGPTLGSAIAHGGIDQFNVVLYTRGDMNYRNVNFDPTQLMAGVSVMSSAVKAVFEGAQAAIGSANSLDDANRVGEVLTRNMPNRMMKGIMSVLLTNGQDIDANGRIISENKNMFETALRIAGLRSSRQQAEIEAFYANKQQQAREAARMETLRKDFRSLVRRGPGWENSISEVFEKYRKLGMRPEHFRTWIQNQVRETQDTRGMGDLQKALKNPQMQQSVWRYNTYGAL